MYSVLLVDDEKVIREGVCELLTLAEPELEIAMAASAPEAIAIFEQRKIDIAVLDVCMPQMSGMELYDILRERWPHCKLIFLTGHLEFEYVYKVHSHARYVLKAEEDRKLVEAVRASICEIESDLMLKQVSQDRSREQRRSGFFERTLLLRELIEGGVDRTAAARELLEHTRGVPDAETPVYTVVLRSTALSNVAYAKRLADTEALCLLIEKHFLDRFRGVYLGYNRTFHYLLLHPGKEASREKVIALLTGCGALYQKAVRANLSISATVCIRESPVPFEQALEDFSAVCDSMLSMEPEEIRVCDPYAAGRLGNGLTDAAKRELSRRIAVLESRFDNMDRDGVLQLVEELGARLQGVSDMQDLFAMEMYCTFSARLFSYVQRVGLDADAATRFGVASLYDLSRYSCWADAFAALKRVVNHVFWQVDASIEDKNDDVVKRVKQYIRRHLDGDTSLYALSEHVHLCPEYVLRVFKKQEGVTILQYINERKLARAKQLLAETDMQIKEIATELSFASAGYFSRFFRSKAGVAPYLYREQKVK